MGSVEDVVARYCSGRAGTQLLPSLSDFSRSLLLKKEAGWHAARLTVAISMPTPLQQSSAGKAAQICINRYLKCLEISRKLGKDIAQQPKQTITVWHRPEHSQLPLYTKPRTPQPPPGCIPYSIACQRLCQSSSVDTAQRVKSKRALSSYE